MINDMNDHTKQYRLINGHRVCISFAKEENTDLFRGIRDILLNCSNTSHICQKTLNDDRMEPTEKEAS